MKRTQICQIQILLFLLLPATLFAQKPGRIRGTVVDAKTKMPFCGALVKIEGTIFESITDENGNYSFFNVAAGEQTLSAYLKGYVRVIRKKVQVAAAVCSFEDFELRPAVYEDEEVVIIATPPPWQEYSGGGGFKICLSHEDLMLLRIRDIKSTQSFSLRPVRL